MERTKERGTETRGKGGRERRRIEKERRKK